MARIHNPDRHPVLRGATRLVHDPIGEHWQALLGCVTALVAVTTAVAVALPDNWAAAAWAIPLLVGAAIGRGEQTRHAVASPGISGTAELCRQVGGPMTYVSHVQPWFDRLEHLADRVDDVVTAHRIAAHLVDDTVVLTARRLAWFAAQHCRDAANAVPHCSNAGDQGAWADHHRHRDSAERLTGTLDQLAERSRRITELYTAPSTAGSLEHHELAAIAAAELADADLRVELAARHELDPVAHWDTITADTGGATQPG